jgi:hypothetical protein
MSRLADTGSELTWASRQSFLTPGVKGLRRTVWYGPTGRGCGQRPCPMVAQSYAPTGSRAQKVTRMGNRAAAQGPTCDEER